MLSRKFILDNSRYIASFLVLVLLISVIPVVGAAGSPRGTPRTNDVTVFSEYDAVAPPTTYSQGELEKPMMMVGLLGAGGPAAPPLAITRVDITHTGSGTNTDITWVKIFQDNGNQVFDGAPTDALLGSTTTWTGSEAQVSPTGLDVVKNIQEYIWITYDFGAAATGTHGCEITDVANPNVDIHTPSGLVQNTLANPPPNSTNVPRAGLPSLTFKVDWVRTYNDTMVQTKAFYSGDTVKVRCNASHTWGKASIYSANITIKGPSGLDVITNQSMTLLANNVGPNNKLFNYDYSLLIPSLRGQYWAQAYPVGQGATGLITNISSNDFTVFNQEPSILGPIPDQNGTEDVPWTYNLQFNKTDLEDTGAALTWNVTSVDPPLQSIDVTGDLLMFNPIADATGSDEVTLTLKDSDGSPNSTTFWVYVWPTDDSPEITSKIPDQEKPEDSPNWTLDLSTYKYDAEDPINLLTWDVYDVNELVYSVNVTGNILEFGLVPNAFGDDEMYINLTDTAHNVVEQKIGVNITEVNDAPEWDPIENIIIKEPEVQDVIQLSDYVTDIDTQAFNINFVLVSNSNSENINVSIDNNDNVDIQLLSENYSGFAVINVSTNDGQASAYQKFSVISILEELITTLRSPTNNSNVTTVTPKLLWSTNIPAGFELLNTVYDVYLDQNVTNVTNFSDSALVAEGQTDEFYSPLTPLDDQGTYYWTVIPKLLDDTGFAIYIGFCNDGVWNFSIDIFAPNQAPMSLLKLPANQNAINSTTVELTWDAFDANGDWPLFYDIYLSTDSELVAQNDETAKILDHTALLQTNFTVMDLQEDTIYYWTVLPHDGVLPGICGDGVWEFGINAENQAPVVTLQSPPDKSRTNATPELRWTVADSDPFDNVTYSLYLSQTRLDVLELNTTTLIKKNYVGTSFEITTALENEATYYWTILPRDRTENGTCDSGIWSFEVNTSAINHPPIVILISPKDNVTVETSSVQLRWKGNDADEDTLNYTLYLGTNITLVELGSEIVEMATIIDNESYDLTELTNDTVYYWTLLVNDGTVDGLCMNGTWSFRVILKEEVEPPEPAENYLFTIDSGFKDELDNGNLSSGLKQAFADNNVQLSDNAEITKEDGGWKITDGDKAYEIKEEDGKLNVYKSDAAEGDDDEDNLGLMIGLIVVVVIIIMLIIVALMVTRKKKEPSAPSGEERVGEITAAEGGEIPTEGADAPVVAIEVAEGDAEAPVAVAVAAPTVGLTPEQVIPVAPSEEGEEAPAELTTCPACSQEIPAGSPTCPSCGGPAPATGEPPEGAPPAEVPPEEIPPDEAVAVVSEAGGVTPEIAAAEELAPTAVPAPAAAPAPPGSVPTPTVGEELPVLDGKPTTCPQCAAENIEFGEDNMGKCAVCDYKFKWNE